MGNDIDHPELPELVSLFVYQQRNPEGVDFPQTYPQILEKGYSYESAVATFYAPSDLSGVGGMTISGFMHVPHGEMGHLTMTVSLLRKILLWQVFVVCLLHK